MAKESGTIIMVLYYKLPCSTALLCYIICEGSSFSIGTTCWYAYTMIPVGFTKHFYQWLKWWCDEITHLLWSESQPIHVFKLISPHWNLWHHIKPRTNEWVAYNSYECSAFSSMWYIQAFQWRLSMTIAKCTIWVLSES